MIDVIWTEEMEEKHWERMKEMGTKKENERHSCHRCSPERLIQNKPLNLAKFKFDKN